MSTSKQHQNQAATCTVFSWLEEVGWEKDMFLLHIWKPFFVFGKETKYPYYKKAEFD